MDYCRYGRHVCRHSIPGIDLILPDAGFIIDKKDDLLGIVLTHAHEDHVGSVAHIWPSLKCKMQHHSQQC